MSIVDIEDSSDKFDKKKDLLEEKKEKM